MFLHKQ